MKNQFNEYLRSMILSASGWRMIFTQNGNGEDSRPEIGPEKTAIAAFIAKTFADYLLGTIEDLPAPIKNIPVIAVGMDTRPTGPAIADCIIRVLANIGIKVHFTGICAAPEIMAYARSLDGFIYISASHNPIGHNGIKFGLNDGGVIPGNIATKLANHFKNICLTENPESVANSLMNNKTKFSTVTKISDIYSRSPQIKKKAIDTYRNFVMQVITDKTDKAEQIKAFEPIISGIKKYHLGIVADMNGSARTLSIDNSFFSEQGLQFYPINNEPGKIVHAIIPEPENLVFCANKMEQLQAEGKTEAILGYMPDCDGDRGNVVYWDIKTKKAQVLKAQEVFSLSVLAELAYSTWESNKLKQQKSSKLAIAVNGPTSMRIDDIAHAFGAYVGRAEVGEANVVNKARELRQDGYKVRILGEGSNGGNITHPAAVRDPINTLFALIKLLSIRDTIATKNTPAQKGLFHLWCEKSNQENLYTDNFTLSDIIETLPKYATTGVSEQRAVLHIQTDNQSKLKANFQKIFENEWKQKEHDLSTEYGFYSYTVSSANGTIITKNINDYSISGKGGLKIIFNNKAGVPIAYMWMRGSGTEPVFRIQCDVKNCNVQKPAAEIEAKLLKWETDMLALADKKN